MVLKWQQCVSLKICKSPFAEAKVTITNPNNSRNSSANLLFMGLLSFEDHPKMKHDKLFPCSEWLPVCTCSCTQISQPALMLLGKTPPTLDKTSETFLK